jgi:predicted AAA+ superfamily ATPase
MKIQQKGHTTIIKDATNDLEAFVTLLTHNFSTYKDQNIIIDISSYTGLTLKDISVFLGLTKMQKKAKKSFIIVIDDFDFNKGPSQMNVVPSLLEAHDIIEMEEIERDLGF